MNKVFLFLFGGSCLLFSCNRTAGQYDKPYFDFDSLMSVQVRALVETGSVINKQSSINGKQASAVFTPDSLTLANELDVFRQLDVINKPLYRKAYSVTDGEKDTKSNLLIRTYSTNSPSPVPFVKFYYQSSLGAIRKIESVYREENALYDTERALLLEFEDDNGSIRLSGYHIGGTQKMILSDTVQFSIDVSFSSDQY